MTLSLLIIKQHFRGAYICADAAGGGSGSMNYFSYVAEELGFDFVWLFCFVLFCFVLFCFVLFCFVLFCFVLFCFVLFCLIILLYIAQQWGNTEGCRQTALEGYAICLKSVVWLLCETKSTPGILHRRLNTVKLFVLSRVLFI